jgi:N utilization substance protein B
MARRSRSREVALQLLFQKDQNATAIDRKHIHRFASDRLRDPVLVAFALDLYDGVLARQADIDKLLTATAENWRLSRMLPADRNVLRLGTFELLHGPEKSPAPVVINEAIELARRFGTADSPKFVNGILDKIAKTPAPTV